MQQIMGGIFMGLVSVQQVVGRTSAYKIWHLISRHLIVENVSLSKSLMLWFR
jgi:hypothetical protein